MVYSNNCVLAVLVNGTPCQELANGSVPIPFNSEYVIRVRNKDKKRRVVAKVFVDGENVAEGGIIVNPNSYVDLEGPVDLHKRFKFVSLDSPDAVDFGKNGPNPDKSKGLIEAHFHFEKEVKTAEEHHHHHYHDWPWWLPSRPYINPPTPYVPYRPTWRGGCFSSVRTSSAAKSSYGMSLGNDSLNDSLGETLGFCEQDISYSANANADGLMRKGFSSVNSVNSVNTWSAAPLQDGCTVEGSYTGQSFNTMSLDYEPEATVLKIFLQGFDPGVSLVKPVVKPSPLRRKKFESEAPVVTECEDAELKALREKKLALQKELERREVEALEKALEQLKTSS